MKKYRINGRTFYKRMTVNEARIQMMLDELKKFAKSMRADLKMLEKSVR